MKIRKSIFYLLITTNKYNIVYKWADISFELTFFFLVIYNDTKNALKTRKRYITWYT